MDREQSIDLIERSRLARHADYLVDQLLPSARVVVHDESSKGAEAAFSFFGGSPRLPHEVVWPTFDRDDYLRRQISRFEDKFKQNPRATGLRDIAARMRDDLGRGPIPLSFIGQICLDELRASVQMPGWPVDGILAFFYDSRQAWGYDPLDRGHCQVLYAPRGREIQNVRPPDSLPNEAMFSERKIRFDQEWILPTRTIVEGHDLSVRGDDEYRDLCERLMEFADDQPIHRCGGHPQEIQGDMRLECQLVTNGIYCGDSSGYRDPRVKSLESGTIDWRLLLQIDSDEEGPGWMWGDSGRVYFWARQQDIAAADFDGSWAILQCY